MRRVIALAGILLAPIACKSLDDGAREHFARTYSCPEDRVQVKPRPDLDWNEVVMGKQAPEVPPEDVAKDPERLAKWRSDHAPSQTRSAMEMFEVNGCDHELLIGCIHPRDPHNGGELLGQVTCSEAPAPPP